MAWRRPHLSLDKLARDVRKLQDAARERMHAQNEPLTYCYRTIVFTANKILILTRIHCEYKVTSNMTTEYHLDEF